MLKPLMLAPPLIFAGLALLFFAGMQRSDPDQLPSAIEGQAAPVVQVAALGTGPKLTDAMLREPGVKLVNFWNQGLHQGASLSLDREENVSDVFYLPLLVCIAGFVLLVVTLVLLRTRTEIRARRLQALLARERMA